MFVAGGEFLQTQGGDKNPYNQDNPTTRLNWDLLELNQEHFEYVRKAIVIRKRNPTLDRSRFWRKDIKWYVPIGNVDFDTISHTLAYFLSRSTQQDVGLYVMVNYQPQEVEFMLLEPGPWYRLADTSLPSLQDFLEE